MRDRVTTREEAIHFLEGVLHYIASHYGGTLAHHEVAKALQRVRED